MNVAPQKVVAGDAWRVPVLFLNADGSSRPLAASEVAGAELYVASLGATYGAADGIVVEMTGPAAGVAHVPTAITAGIAPLAPSAWQAAGYPVRLHGFVTDSAGARTTYSATPLLAVDWRTDDLSEFPGTTSVVAVVGPAGPTGAPGPAGADDFINSLIFG